MCHHAQTGKESSDRTEEESGAWEMSVNQAQVLQALEFRLELPGSMWVDKYGHGSVCS